MAETGFFKPKGDAKGEATTKTARTIIEGEAAARQAKTERLRAARLARSRLKHRQRKSRLNENSDRGSGHIRFFLVAANGMALPVSERGCAATFD